MAASTAEVEARMPGADDVAAAIAGGSDDAALIADSLERIATAADELLTSGLSDRALVLLLADLSRVNRRDIQRVLDALGRLREFTGSDDG